MSKRKHVVKTQTCSNLFLLTYFIILSNLLYQTYFIPGSKKWSSMAKTSRFWVTCCSVSLHSESLPTRCLTLWLAVWGRTQTSRTYWYLPPAPSQSFKSCFRYFKSIMCSTFYIMSKCDPLESRTFVCSAAFVHHWRSTETHPLGQSREFKAGTPGCYLPSHLQPHNVGHIHIWSAKSTGLANSGKCNRNSTDFMPTYFK